MALVVKEVSTAKDTKRFIRFPYRLNRRNAFWVPPLLMSQESLLSERHYFWRNNKHKFFLAYDGNVCVGRAAAFCDSDHESHFKIKQGFFGFLEAVGDAVVFHQLLQHCEQFLNSLGCKSIIGPLSPSIHYELGVLTEGFEQRPYFMMPYNVSYYDRHITAYGFTRLKSFSAYKLNVRDFLHTSKMTRAREILQKRHHITLRIPDLNKFEQELRIFHDIYNSAFAGHWGFAPICWEDFYSLGKDMKMILDKDMVLIAEKDGKAIGFLLAIPDLNEVLVKIEDGRLFPFGLFKLLALKRKIKSLRVITVAIKKEYQHLGIGGMLYPEIAQRAKLKGYEQTELSWVVDDNVQMNKICNESGGHVYKKYALYEKKLT
jgi:GNAT superfamily N-acetyltransferase